MVDGKDEIYKYLLDDKRVYDEMININHKSSIKKSSYLSS